MGAVKIKDTPIPNYVLATMPQKVINYIAENFDQVFGSPYSDSYYSQPGQSWDFTPENQIRVANHWNFYSRNYNDPFSVSTLHAQTNIPVKNNTHWTIARKENGIYHVIMSLPVVSKVKTKNYNNDLLAQKEPNEILYKFKAKVDEQKRKDEFIRLQNARLKSITEKSLHTKIDKLDISKSSIVFQELKTLSKSKNRIRPVYQRGSGRNTQTVDNTTEFEKALRKLNLRFSTTNDAPRGGKMGNLITIETKIK